MVVIKKDDKIRKVGLTGDEIDFIITILENQPYGLFKFLNYGRIVKKLKDVK